MISVSPTYQHTMDSLLEARTGDSFSLTGKTLYPGTQPLKKTYRSVPSAEGLITSMLLVCNSDTATTPGEEEKQALMEQYSAICEAFSGRDITLYIMLPGAAFEAGSMMSFARENVLRTIQHPAGPRIRFIGGGDATLPENLNPQFVQDYIHACEMKGSWHNGRNAIKLLRPVTPPKKNLYGNQFGISRIGQNLRVNERLASALPAYNIQYTSLYTEGGNLHVIRDGEEDILLCGTNNIRLNRRHTSPVERNTAEDEKIKEEIAKLFQADRTIWIENHVPAHKNFPSLLFHIDLFVTPAGCLPSGRFLLLVGEISKAYTFIRQQHLPDTEWPARLEDHKKYLDGVALYLGQQGFEIVRIPMPIVQDAYDEAGSYLLSYNNALAESKNGEGRLYMPSFTDEGATHTTLLDKIALLENELKNKLEPYFKRGICFIKAGYHQMSRDNKGALHCSVKVLERD